MITKKIRVEVDKTTWPKGTATPTQLTSAAGYRDINLGKALLMLGTLTTPHIYSAASPSRFWAWLRYFLAPASGPKFRIRMPFAELDPHQKGILSDDFGVAVATQWLFDCLGGFSEIVDGRLFILQFSHLLRKRVGPTAKVGPTKAPDFVIKDNMGKWHVLECKGTQSGRSTRDRFLKSAVSQKQVVQLKGRLRGQRLASGLAISNVMDNLDTHLRIIDPEEDALLILSENEAKEMDLAARTISVASAIGLMGFDALATELTLPDEIESTAALLTKSETARIRTSRAERIELAVEQTKNRQLKQFQHLGRKYEGRVIRFDRSDFGEGSPFDFIEIRQGINAAFVKSLQSIGPDLKSDLRQRSEPCLEGAKIALTTNGPRISLVYGDFLYSEVTLGGSVSG